MLKIGRLFALFRASQDSVYFEAGRSFSSNRRSGDKAGNASAPGQQQIDWKEWVTSKLPGIGSSPAGASQGSGLRPSPEESQSSFESPDDFERRMFGGFNDNDSHPDSFFQKLDRIEKARGKTSTGFAKEDWNGDLGWEDDHIGPERDTLNDGMDNKLKRAALEHDYGMLRPDEEYSFRPDTTFPPGTQYTVQDLDLTKPAVQRIYRRPTFQTTTKEVLRKADFRNVRFLQHFITEAGIIWPRKKFGISAKAQRKLIREIKTARAFGLLPFTTMGKKPFIFGKTMEDLDEDYQFDGYVENADDLEDSPEVVGNEDLDIPDLNIDGSK
uniref:Small ribosomal subunit protein bS18c n=1 Tax=Araucaria cunninghamii TaxID=56994 RepID=A0A0D6RAQ2_ARACU